MVPQIKEFKPEELGWNPRINNLTSGPGVEPQYKYCNQQTWDGTPV
jgi:hypothetical protein